MTPQIQKKLPAGEFRVIHRRMNPVHEAEYWPVWNRYTALIEAGKSAEAEEVRLRELVPLQIEVGPEEVFSNLVTDVGCKLMLDSIFNNTAAGAVVMGLKGTGSAAVGDTQASHAGWSEVGGTNAPAYTGNRPTPSFSAASGSGAGSRTKATSANVTFAMTSSGTVAGGFLNIAGSATKDNTTGTLFSAGDFSSSKTVSNGDTISASYQLSA